MRGWALAATFGLIALAMPAEQYQWDLPKGFPIPKVPADNPMSTAKVRLGRYLFYDKQLSVNGTESCASCHRQELAFTDGRPRAIGATGQVLPRGAMSLVNVAYSAILTWNRTNLRSLEEHALVPLLSGKPIELGLGGRGDEFVRRLHSDETYRSLFPPAFPGEPDSFTIVNVAKAIAAFERTVISARSPWDCFHYDGDPKAISDSAKRGEVIFFTDGFGSCYRCHGGINFSDAEDYEGRAPSPVELHNTGLYNLPGLFSYPPPNVGLYEYTKRPADVGKFKAPTLRNIALTAPYMHDGSISTLEDVVDHYVAGGRTIAGGPCAGVGRDNPNKDRRIKPLPLSRQNRLDLVAFLRSLTDEEVTRDPRFSDPW